VSEQRLTPEQLAQLNEVAQTWDTNLNKRFERADAAMRHLPALLAEVAALREALVEADWVIGKLAPHEKMAILVRGFRPDAADVERGAKSRRMIDAALTGKEVTP
jgi:hypothetical protein